LPPAEGMHDEDASDAREERGKGTPKEAKSIPGRAGDDLGGSGGYGVKSATSRRHKSEVVGLELISPAP
jgi:hypothetical protein